MAKRLFIGNLPYSVDDEALRAMFAQAGEVSTATVIIDRMSGRSKGFGFVEMASDEDTEKAKALDGNEVDGRKLVVNEARPMEDRGPRRDFRNDRRNNY